jgi:hypothetical protein
MCHKYCPSLFGLHHSIIHLDRKKDPWFALFLWVPLSFPCLLKFLFYPFTLDRMLGEDQQDLVMCSDRFINAITVKVPRLQVFWRKPTANPIALQVFLIFTR